MSIKSLIQILITFLILFIIVAVYYEYFNINKKSIQEVDNLSINTQEQFNNLEKKIIDLELKNKELTAKINENKENIKEEVPKILDSNETSSNQLKTTKEDKKRKDNELSKTSNLSVIKKKDTKNLVKDVEYTSVDEKGNRFYLLANSGKSNVNDNNILDLDNVRGKITSDYRDTIYIVSDFAQYNSMNLNSKFYQNVIIDYQDKRITCVNFDINMETNMAIAYNDVVITDPKSVMKAGIVEFDLKTKDIEIKPESETKEIEVVTN